MTSGRCRAPQWSPTEYAATRDRKDDKLVIKIYGCKKKDTCPAYDAVRYSADLDRSGRIWSR